ncbi:F-box/kelch-repeat protein At3g06240-like [Rosa rugosa]|uniref:F-box/kelch-repeat protein At3g06240-like n=1 Tax=Rosa rugosa TaxID=74645 RepID=UPI002B410106|nr:F-box/kelch-repeat protein At3g06240-like [Rosa rugosa]
MLKKKKHLDLQRLPEHVVFSILCRLPVKSLIRFTCVSKRWRSVIISDHQFGNSHFQLAASQLRHNVLISRSPDYISEGTQFQSLEDNFSIKNLTCPFQRYSTIQVMGSCNGLVVLANFYPNVLSYWPCCLRDRYNILVMRNPSTGFFRKIPYPNFQIGSKKWTLENKEIRVYYGFGQVSASNDYKLVVILNYGGFMEVRVFSVRANCWKVVKAPYLSPYRPWSEELGTYSNGAIHWVSLHEPGFLEPPVYAFDLANEEFREMPLPVLSHNEYGMQMTQTRTPVLLGGCLCVMFQDAD